LIEEEFEYTNEAIRIRKLKTDRKHNGQNKKYKQRSTKHTHKIKDQTILSHVHDINTLKPQDIL